MSLVLLAEDEAPMLEMLSAVVQRMGHEPRTAEDGERALQLALAQRPDLIVLDYMMPGIDGLEVVARLKRHPTLKDVPVVMTTAARLPRTDGVDRLLEKPFGLDAFEAVVQESLAGARVAPPPVAEPLVLDVQHEELLNWVVHEIKSPLAVVRMAVDLTAKDVALPDASGRRLRNVVRQIDRVHRLVDALLDASSLAEGRLRVRADEIDLGDVVARTVQSWADAQPDRVFATATPDAPVLVAADEERVAQILDNLLSNAVKHAGGAPRVDVVVAVAGGVAEVRVQDQGPGIDAAAAATLFQRFHRLADARAPGHGLGLYVSSTLARMMGGRLVVDSEPGRGTAFVLSLPVAPKA